MTALRNRPRIISFFSVEYQRRTDMGTRVLETENNLPIDRTKFKLRWGLKQGI